MGKDVRLWRKEVKKLRRQLKRRARAQQLLKLFKETSSEEGKSKNNDNYDYDEDESSEDLKEVDLAKCENEEDDPDRRYFLSQREWEEREEQVKLESALTRAEQERMEEIEAEKQKKIREEWEAKQEHERKLKEEKERLEKQMKDKQVKLKLAILTVSEADFNEFLSFLSGDIETPPTKYLMPEDISCGNKEELCYYFAKTATCRFNERCTKLHPRPTLSTAILIPNFFSHLKLEKAVRDEYDSDLGLEYEDKELQKEFLEFYDDVVPELRKSGSLLQFKVCCNLEPHLRGNVYIQYQTIREAYEAFQKFNGRFYNGKQLSLQFIKMDSWRSAICGSFQRKMCLKGRICNYLHVFRNPTKEFVQADRDWKEIQRPASTAKTSHAIDFLFAKPSASLQEAASVASKISGFKPTDQNNKTEYTETGQGTVPQKSLQVEQDLSCRQSSTLSSHSSHNSLLTRSAERDRSKSRASSKTNRERKKMKKRKSGKLSPSSSPTKHKKKSKSKKKKKKLKKSKKKKEHCDDKQ